MENHKRPTGVTLVAVLLILIALNGIYSVMGSVDEGLIWIAKASAVDLLNAGFRLAYTVCAALAAIALWEMKSWAMRAYVAWGLLHVAGHAVHDCILKLQGKIDFAWWAVLLGPIVVAIVVGLVGIGLSKSLKKSA